MTKPTLTLVDPTLTQEDIIQQCLNPTMSQIIHAKFKDAMTPGFAVPFDPDEAEYAGAFEEDALTEAEALAGSIDLVGDLHE